IATDFPLGAVVFVTPGSPVRGHHFCCSGGQTSEGGVAFAERQRSCPPRVCGPSQPALPWYQRCQSAPSRPRQNTSRWSGAQLSGIGSDFSCPPSDSGPNQPVPSYQRCQSALSRPRQNTSSRLAAQLIGCGSEPRGV